jgi:alpha-tubulin suppressor-like RCC1 family protein
MRRRALITLAALCGCRWDVVLGADGISLRGDAATLDAPGVIDAPLVVSRDVPTDVPQLVDVAEDLPETPMGTLRSVVPGGDFSCVVRSDDSVWCWGANARGQLGAGTTAPVAAPVRVRGLGGVSSMVAGNRHACALLRGGDLRCWGANDRGQLGDGTTIDRAIAVSPAGLDGVEQVSVGAAHTCAQNGEAVRCWGANDRGQLGDGSTTDRARFVAVAGDYRRVLAGGAFTAAETAEGAVYVWGANEHGQLGDGTTADRSVPGPVTGAGAGALRLLAVGHAHALARSADGSTFGWGDGLRGALGDGAMAVRTTPIAIAGWREFTSLVAGDGFTCGALGSDAVACAGANELGQLGDGTGVGNPVPQRITEFSRSQPRTMAAGPAGACGIIAETDLWCWGDNAVGQLAPGGPLRLLRPMLVAR